MNTLALRIIPVLLAGLATVTADTPVYTNLIRQVQAPSGVQWDVPVTPSGEQISALAVEEGGARFELWTVKNSPLTSYLLDTRYVGSYVPTADVVIRTDDPCTLVKRTRADRPFYVDVTISGLLAGSTSPEASKSVKLLRHVQSYGASGTAETINRTQATLFSQASISENGKLTLTYPITSVPGADRTKVRGEERFSVYSLEDYQAPESQLASQTIQVWPVASSTISGLAQNQLLRFQVPQITLTLTDLYPSSTTYAQVYTGEPRLGVTGKTVPGSALVINEAVPQNRVLTLKGYEAIFDEDGRWTMEILTSTPFGIDRISTVSFNVNQSIKVNGNLTTVD